MTNWIGKTLGRVRIESLLARGGMAEVYIGTHTTLHRNVAVKILRSFYSDDPRLRPYERFELEARAVAKLRHPNIVQVYDFDTVEDQPYLVMEYIPGPPLSKYLATLHARGDRLGLPLISRLLTRIASALQYAHQSGVIHRDVKPGNILLTSRSTQIAPGETLPLDLEPVLTDFGLVRFLNASRQTASGLITGTPTYMSPEQALGEASDGRTDIYSLGVVLYEMLRGEVPFDAESTVSILLKHLHEAPPPIPGLSPAIQRVLDRALAKKRDDRFQTPDELAAAFEHAVEHTDHVTTMVTIPQVLEIATAKEVTPAKEQTNWLPILLTGMLVLFAGAVLLWSMRSRAASAELPARPSPTVSLTPVFGIPVTFGATSTLRFQDGNAILDRVILDAQAMPASPDGTPYEVWLVRGEERLSLGALQLDGEGKGELSFEDPEGRNLLAEYDRVEVTIQLNGSQELLYAYALPESGLAYLRGLMVSFPSTPDQVGLIHGLVGIAALVDEAGRDMLTAYEGGNEAEVRANAESILNLLVGDQSGDHKDWDGDGQVTDPGDGYGLFINANNLGYIQAVYSYADYAVNSPGASQNMINHGGDVKTCLENLARWTPELRDHLLNILAAGSLADVEQRIQRSADLTHAILNGVDQNENGEIDPISEECGAFIAYQSTYRMADMPLLPVTINPLLTPLAVSETVTPLQTASPYLLFPPTSTRQPGGNPPPATNVPPTQVQPTQAPPTDEPPPPNEPQPTKEPKPTKEPPPTKEPKPTKEPHPTKEPKPTKNKP